MRDEFSSYHRLHLLSDAHYKCCGTELTENSFSIFFPFFVVLHVLLSQTLKKMHTIPYLRQRWAASAFCRSRSAPAPPVSKSLRSSSAPTNRFPAPTPTPLRLRSRSYSAGKKTKRLFIRMGRSVFFGYL